MKRLFLVLVLLLAATVVEAQQDGTAEVSFDGLVKLERGLFKESWVDLDVDFLQYTKIILVDPYFEFRAVKRTASGTGRIPNQRRFYISDPDRQKLIETVAAVLKEEYAKSEHFTIVDKPGPDVAIIEVGILDIVSRVPPRMIGRGEIYLSSVGDATLVVEMKDSLSQETIFRGVERKSAGQKDAEMARATTVTTWAEVQRLAGRWAVKMREGLDAIHSQ